MTPVVTQAVDKTWPREGIGGASEFHRLSFYQVERAWERAERHAHQLREEEEEKRIIEAAITAPLSPSTTLQIESANYSEKLFNYQQDVDLAKDLEDKILLHLHGHSSKILAQQMFLEGLIISDNRSDVIQVKNILCDSGALHGSYMNKRFLDKIRHQLALSQIRKVSSDVRLGDNKTIVSINEVAILDLLITLKESTSQKEYTVKEIFSVIETGPDLIFGLPTIVRCIPDLFKYMIDKACDTLKILQKVSDSLPEDSGDTVNRIEQLTDDYFEDIIENPWSNHEEEAPEELESDLPVNFGSALHFMEIGYEASVQEYEDLFETHVEKLLREDHKFMDLLKTKGVRVFVPQNWEGIKVEPIELEFSKDMPDSIKVPLRPVNPKLFEHAKNEFERLKKYFYVDSTSSIVSNLVIAPKATKPFIRFCGDYVKVNQYISRIHTYIPQIQHELGKIQKFKIFLDLDMTNSFHQFKLGRKTSEKLSVLTPWGCVRPIFMPEGVSPATSILQNSNRKILADFEEWSICVFDNFLILAHDIPDARKKLEIFLDRCIEYNIYLKFSKSWLGFKEVKFFGYVCSHESYRLEQSRLESIREIPFPNSNNKAANTKKIQSFLGAALFFQPFVENYSDKAAPLNDLVHKNFSWDKSTWKIDYVQKFEDFKSSLIEMVTLYYPNYELEWIVQTDASEYGVGGALMQIYVRPDGVKEKQPLFFVSAKFSPQAFKWSMIEKEAYGIYYTVKKLSYHLSGKTFILETDHQNLIWIEASLVPKIIRWRIYLQSYMIFVKDLKRIKGTDNKVADFLSRIHVPDGKVSEIEDPVMLSHINVYYEAVHDGIYPIPDSFEDLCHILLPLEGLPAEESIISNVHGGRKGHWGAQATWIKMKEVYPGHNVSFKAVQEFIKKCPTCQKVRLLQGPAHNPVIRHLKPTHPRAVVGMDTVTISPKDEFGNLYCDSIVNHFDHFFFGRPKATHDAESTAESLLQYISLYGLFDTLITDPGSDFTSDVMSHLSRFLGYAHKFSLVDRHESNGCEQSHSQLLRHLRAICNDERLRHCWSSPKVFCFVTYLMNSHLNSETNSDNYSLRFGTLDSSVYYQLPLTLTADNVPGYIRELNNNLQLVRQVSKEYQDGIVAKRTAANLVAPQTLYQPGDYVLLRNNHPENKLQGPWLGPYQVVQQDKNDVICKDLVSGSIMTHKPFHVENLKLFEGTDSDAYAQALLDREQFVIREFLAYRGDPEMRTNCEFEVAFEAGAVKWLVWTPALYDTIQYEEFCSKDPALMPLLYPVKEANNRIKALKRLPITAIQPTTVIYLNLRWYSHDWYKQLPLPDLFHTQYVVKCTYGNYVSNTHQEIYLHDTVFGNKFTVDNFFVYSWGSVTVFNADTMVLVNKEFVRRNPCLK